MEYIAVVLAFAIGIIAGAWHTNSRWQLKWTEKKEDWKHLCEVRELYEDFLVWRCKLAEGKLNKERDTNG